MKLRTQDECIEALRTYYKEWDADSLSKSNHKGFVGCLQWQFTPEAIVDLNNFDKEKEYAVVINLEFIHYLIKYGVNRSNIKFYTDCDWKSAWAIKIAGIDPTNVITLSFKDSKEIKEFIKMAPKSVDYVLNNVPFGMFKEFKSLAEQLAKEKALIISGSRDYHNNEKSFENVEIYKYLGDCFPTAKIVASLAILNPNGAKSFNIIDSKGISHVVKRNHAIAPSTNVQDYIWALNILDKKLPGYTKFKTGGLYRKDAKFDANGVKVAFTMGKASSPFDSSNYGSSYSDIQKQQTAWSTVELSQQHLLGGFGEHAIGISYMANEPGHLGNVKYMPPDMGCGEKTYWHPVTDEQDAEAAIKYLNHPDVIRLVSVLKSCVSSNSKETFSLIPHHYYAKSWIQNYV